MEQQIRRVTLVIHALYGGGAERVMCELANRWSSMGHEVSLITLAATETDRYATHASVQRVGLDAMGNSRNKLAAWIANRNRIKLLRSAIERARPDRILSFCDRMNVLCLQACRGLNVPIWISERSDPRLQKMGWIWEWARRRTYPTCTGCVVQTGSVKQYLTRFIQSDRIMVIPNAVHRPKDDSSSRPCSEIETYPGKHVLLSAGRLSVEKGFDVLLQAWGQVHESLPNWILLLVGEGAERNRLESLARELRISESVHFLGWRADLWPIYGRADLYVMPSRYEGFPVALLEAMSMDKPCIATRCSEAIDILSNAGRALECVQVGDPSEMAQSILKLAQSSNLRAELGTQAHQVAAEFTWEKIGPMWDQILR